MALRGDRHALSGVYALDALDTAAEAARFERHLSRCQACASEVRGFRDTATRLALAVVLINTQNQLGRTQQQLSQAKQHLSQAQTELAAINAVRTAADATLVTKATPIGGKVTVVSSASRGQLVVTTSGLPALRAGKTYQLWLIGAHGNKIRSEGLLALHNGRSGPTLISGVLRGDIFGITLEPAGGTVQPTVAPFVAIPA